MDDNDINIDYRELLQNSIDANLENYILKLNECNAKFCELAVHDVRVRIRRFLSLLSMIRFITNLHVTSEISMLLKDQFRIFDPLRDIQVQLLKVQHIVYNNPVLYEYYHHLLNCEEGYIPLLKHGLNDFDILFLEKLVKNLKFELNIFYSGKNTKIVRPQDIACQRFTQVITRFNLSKREDVRSIHKIRLSFKKFRYTMEIVQPITNMLPEVFKEMSDFQSLLGDIQDLTVFSRKIQEFAELQEKIPKIMFEPIADELLSEREVLINKFYSNFNKVYSLWKPEYLS
ncbi:MAG: CHAD domain-containing protein [bacterium]